MSDFEFIPDFGLTKSVKPTVRSAKFGDGYEQRVAFGINTQPENYDLVFSNRGQEETDNIEEFLSSRAGVDVFTWTPPGATTEKKFICREWSIQWVNPSLYTINCKFEQVFDP